LTIQPNPPTFKNQPDPINRPNLVGWIRLGWI